MFAIFGVIVNFIAAIFTRGGDSLNQKAINLHMLEDVLGWIVVLLGAIIMKFTNIVLIDPIMSLGVALYILINAVKNLYEATSVFLDKAPENIDIDEVINHILNIDEVIDVHHIHIRSIDGHNNSATMHIVTSGDSCKIKEKVREELREHGIAHATLELETVGEECGCKQCNIEFKGSSAHQHHHHHH